MGIFDFLFGNKDNKDSFKPFVFRSDSHQLYQNGSPVMGLQECIRTVCPFLKEVDSFLDVYCLLFTLCLCGVDWSGSIPGRS